MMMPDGSVVSAGARTPPRKTINQALEQQNGLMRCKIVKVHYIDDPDNTSRDSGSPHLQYTVIVLDGPNQGSLINRVTDSSEIGGKSNFSEVVRKASSTYNPKTDASKDYHNDDADIVLVQNIQGQTSNPMIVGACKHPKAVSTATRANGQQSVKEINGVRTTIRSDGTYVVENMGGPVDRDGNRTNPDAAGSSIGMSSDGTMAMARGQQKMELDKDGQISMKGPDGTEFGMASGGTTTMKSTTTDLKAEAAFNVKSTLTSIGQGGMPSVKVGDLAIGTDSHGAPVISRLISGSFLALVGS